MRDIDKSNFKDRMYELLILLVFVLGFSLPVILINLLDILSKLDFAVAFGAPAFNGLH